jgi:hypothetical protein
MSRPLVSRLTSAAVEKRGVGTLTDPAVAGLMLRVRKTSTRGIVREFRFRYKFKRRTGVITLGSFPGVSLADARARAQRFRDLHTRALRDSPAPNPALGGLLRPLESHWHEQRRPSLRSHR